MVGSICWQVDIQDSGMVARNVEVEFDSKPPNGFQGYLVGDNDLVQDVTLGPIWKSEAFCGSRTITFLAQTNGKKEGMLLRAKTTKPGNGSKFRIVVTLQGKINLKVLFKIFAVNLCVNSFQTNSRSIMEKYLVGLHHRMFYRQFPGTKA